MSRKWDSDDAWHNGAPGLAARLRSEEEAVRQRCCFSCGQERELRLGCCWDCATAGEERALKRTVVQHIAHSFGRLAQGRWFNWRTDLAWAWERLTKTGDYRP